MASSADQRKEDIAKCVSDISVADFVALDLEFSGLFLETEREQRPLGFEELFKKCLESVPSFLPLQLGVCCARHFKDRGIWELRSHEFNLWPLERRIFTADLQSMRFLRAHQFDFNAFFERAFPYCRLPPLDSAAASKAGPPNPSHVTKVLAALRDARVPVVVHNGLMDMLHIHDKFLGPLPGDWEEFGRSWSQHFPLVFDTRLLGQEGRFQVLKHSGGLNLQELHRHLLGCRGDGARFDRAGPLPDGGNAHGSSGHDATLTAEVFVMEVDMWLRHHGAAAALKAKQKETDEAGWSVVQSSKKRAREAENGAVGLTSAELLETHEVCRRFHNRIAVVGVGQGGALSLGRPPGPQRATA